MSSFGRIVAGLVIVFSAFAVLVTCAANHETPPEPAVTAPVAPARPSPAVTPTPVPPPSVPVTEPSESTDHYVPVPSGGGGDDHESRFCRKRRWC